LLGEEEEGPKGSFSGSICDRHTVAVVECLEIRRRTTGFIVKDDNMTIVVDSVERKRRKDTIRTFNFNIKGVTHELVK